MVDFKFKKSGLFAAGVLLEQQESRSLQARMRRSFTQDAQQPF